MISPKTLKTIEFDKVLSILQRHAVLDKTKKEIAEFSPVSELDKAKFWLDKTDEAAKLFYIYGTDGIYYARDIGEELDRADKGGTLNNRELLGVAENLKSARLIKKAVLSVHDDTISLIPSICSRLIENHRLEEEIQSKILSEEEISDNASPTLYSIRRNIRELNAKIRDKLNSYIRGGSNKYLQDCVVTMRQDRYVIPVKSEYRSQIRGFIHDQSSSGATVFIEPERIMEYNNELKRAKFEEADEIYRILADLTQKVSYISQGLRYNYENLTELDHSFARAMYAFETKSIKPILNDSGRVIINKGRHPLIPAEKVVPLSLNLGNEFNFLLITGPNTGGKTVTLKLVGLFTAMAMSGMYVPAENGTVLSVFSGVFCDMGDEQSIEQNLSTFSSHIKNIIFILDNMDEKSLVLLDEIGAGTDPEEGSALALSIIKKLLSSKCCGIITTHYSKLKEFAMEDDRIMNASMEFDAETLKPLYKINIGIPGSSNAIEIAKTLGISEDIISDALLNISPQKSGYEKIIKCAEESRRKYELLQAELEKLKSEKQSELEDIRKLKHQISDEKEKIFISAKQETKRIVSERLEEAEEIVDELKDILKRANLESREVFRAAELKNRLNNSKYLERNTDYSPAELKKVSCGALKKGYRIYVKSLDAYGEIYSIKPEKKEVEVLIGDIKTVVKLSDVFDCEQQQQKNKQDIRISKNNKLNIAENRLNVIGKTAIEAIEEVRNFIDRAVVSNLEEIVVVHGVGEGILLKAIRDYLKKDKNVSEFRRGRYGEGENGVTVIKLK